MSRRGLQIALGVIGSVMTIAGTLSVVFGTSVIPGVGDVPASVDSELRFYAAWYLAAGLMLLRAIPRAESEALVVRGVCVIFFIAACGRAISIAIVGEPHARFVFLMVVEFLIPVVIIPWQASVVRARSGEGNRNPLG